MKDYAEEYMKDLEFNVHKLNEEWENQPSLYMKWAERHAVSVFERDQKKQNMEIVYAEIESNVRNDPISFGLKKVTESTVRGAVLMSDEYKAAVTWHQESVKNMLIVASAKEAINQRKAALENEVKLWLGEYFADKPFDSPEARTEDTKSKVKRRRVNLKNRKTN